MLDNYSIINFHTPLKTSLARNCNGCTACCEGWLAGTVYGHNMSREKPCQFIKKDIGCTIYAVRPSNPCKTFKCYWKQDETVPDKFKPNVCGNIMIYRNSDNILHLDILEGTKSLDSELLDWALERYLKKKINSLRWFTNNNTKMNYVSRDEKFIEKMNV